MDPLPFTLTDAGRAAIIDAEGGGTASVTIAEVGLTNTDFEATPGLSALPGEIKRIGAVSGQAADAFTLHMTVRDGTTETFAFSGIGIYLADGTLFGTYSQEAPIAAKTAASLLFYAFDLKLSAAIAELFEFGNANFLYPPATEPTRGVARLATLEQVQDGEDGETIVTPAMLKLVYVALEMLGIANGVATLDAEGKLAPAQRPSIDAIDVFPVADEVAMLALPATPGDFAVRTELGLVYILQELPATTLANWVELNTPSPVTSVNGKVGTIVLVPADIGAVPTARSITGTGLATGGGNLEANRTIDVAIASAAEALAGAINTKAVTPASLISILARIADKVPLSRIVTGAGLAVGGGALMSDLEIRVTAATAAEALAGIITDKAVTPAALASILTLIAGKVATSRNFNTSGLVSGGGNMTADRTFTVLAASAAETMAMAISNKAVTPAALSSLINSIRSVIPTVTVTGSGTTMVAKIGPLIIQLFQGSSPANTTTHHTLPEAFTSSCVGAWVNGGTTAINHEENGPWVSNRTNVSVSITNGIDVAIAPVQILAIGR